MQHWNKLEDDKENPWPKERECHAAVCLGFGGAHPQLLVVGGASDAAIALSDMWVLDIGSWRWREVRV